MRVHLLGTGTFEAQSDRASTGLAFESASKLVLVDCGRNVLSRAVECGLDPLRASAVVLTHLHPDHCCELVSLLFARNYHRDPAGHELGEMRIVGPAGTTALVEAIAAAWRWCEPGPRLEVVEVDGGWRAELGGLEIEAHRVAHGANPALGYRVSEGSMAVAFTGDTGPAESLLALAKGAELLVSECGQRAGDVRAAHLGPDDVAELVRRARPRRVVLTHFYPEIDRQRALRRIRSEVDAEVVLGEDRMVFDLGGAPS